MNSVKLDKLRTTHLLTSSRPWKKWTEEWLKLLLNICVHPSAHALQLSISLFGLKSALVSSAELLQQPTPLPLKEDTELLFSQALEQPLIISGTATSISKQLASLLMPTTRSKTATRMFSKLLKMSSTVTVFAIQASSISSTAFKTVNPQSHALKEHKSSLAEDL